MADGNSVKSSNNFNPAVIGPRIQKYRLKAGIAIDDLAKSVGVSPEVISNIEAGSQHATLPQLEVLGILFHKKVTDFWAEDEPEDEEPYPTLDVIALRQRIIGVLLKQARTEAGYSEQEVAEVAQISAEQVSQYETGQVDIPLPQLFALSSHLNLPINLFLENGVALADKSLGPKLTTLDQLVQFSNLPEETRDFLTNPANLLYLNIAVRLSELSVDTLRGLAEGLLEVTY